MLHSSLLAAPNSKQLAQRSLPQRSGAVCRVSTKTTFTQISASTSDPTPNTSSRSTASERAISASRQATLVPQPVPIIHSSAYLLQRQDNAFLIQQPAEDNRRATPEANTGSAIERALRRVDQSLDEIERNPPVLQKAIYEVAHGPLGTATAKGVGMAAKATVKATVEAAKVAAPLGQWAMRQGFKLVTTVAAKALEQQQLSRTTKIKADTKK